MLVGETLEVKPLECCFRSMLRVIVLLEGEPPSQSQISGRLNQVSLKNFSVFSSIHHSFHSAVSHPHSMMLVLGVMRGVGFAADIAFSMMAKKLDFSLI